VGQEHPRHSAAAELALQEIGLAQGALKLVLKVGAHDLAVRRETENLEFRRGEGHLSEPLFEEPPLRLLPGEL
jgi:hypothetical protein